jgi:hypothetical protein
VWKGPTGVEGLAKSGYLCFQLGMRHDFCLCFLHRVYFSLRRYNEPRVFAHILAPFSCKLTVLHVDIPSPNSFTLCFISNCPNEKNNESTLGLYIICVFWILVTISVHFLNEFICKHFKILVILLLQEWTLFFYINVPLSLLTPYSGLFRLKLERLYCCSPTANTWEQYYYPSIILRDHLPEVWDGALSWDLSGDEVLGAVVASNPTCIDVIII